ncbi:MAG: VOC family protein [Candidatus Binatia bacterium]
MFTIGKLFHLTHVVSNLEAMDRWYDDVFSVNRFYRQYLEEAVRDASLACIGDCVMESVQLAYHIPGAERSPIGKFYARFGQRFHSIAWYVDSVKDLCAALHRHNLHLYDITGKLVTEPEGIDAVWTHPKQTHGLLEFITIGSFEVQDVRLQPNWSAAFWRDQHPLGIEQTSHVTVLIRDLQAAKTLYLDILGGQLIHAEEIAGQKKSLFFAVGEDTIIETAQPLSATSPEGRELQQAGEGLYAVTFKTKNITHAADFLQAKKQRIEWQGSETFVLNREDAFGLVVGFTQRQLPNDPC